MNQIILLASAALFAALCNGYSSTEDRYFDVLIGNIRSEVRNRGINKVRVSNVTFNFKGGGKGRSTARFYSGQMLGLDKLTRSGHCGKSHFSHGQKSINCTLILPGISVRYSGRATLGLRDSVLISGRVNITKSLVFVEVGQGQHGSVLRQTHLSHVGKAIAGVIGNRQISLNNSLRQRLANKSSEEFRRIVTQAFLPAIHAAVSRTPFPR